MGKISNFFSNVASALGKKSDIDHTHNINDLVGYYPPVSLMNKKFDFDYQSYSSYTLSPFANMQFKKGLYVLEWHFIYTRSNNGMILNKPQIIVASADTTISSGSTNSEFKGTILWLCAENVTFGEKEGFYWSPFNQYNYAAGTLELKLYRIVTY